MIRQPSRLHRSDLHRARPPAKIEIRHMQVHGCLQLLNLPREANRQPAEPFYKPADREVVPLNVRSPYRTILYGPRNRIRSVPTIADGSNCGWEARRVGQARPERRPTWRNRRERSPS